MDVRHHRDEDRAADDDVEGEGVDALQGEAVLHDAEHNAADETADDRGIDLDIEESVTLGQVQRDNVAAREMAR